MLFNFIVCMSSINFIDWITKTFDFIDILFDFIKVMLVFNIVNRSLKKCDHKYQGSGILGGSNSIMF